MLHSFLEFVGQKIQVEDITGKDPKNVSPTIMNLGSQQKDSHWNFAKVICINFSQTGSRGIRIWKRWARNCTNLLSPGGGS